MITTTCTENVEVHKIIKCVLLFTQQANEEADAASAMEIFDPDVTVGGAAGRCRRNWLESYNF